MQDRLAENIRLFRKQCGLTQEQLSEAVHVSAGVISKWELGLSTPELSILMELADFFEVSVDVLLGYEMQSNSKEQFLRLLKQCTHDKSADMPVEQVEKQLRKYPHDFDIVYHSAKLYALKGIEACGEAFHHRALELYEQACRLISQNTDPEISATSICTQMAQAHRSLGQREQAAELLKKHNPCGVNNAQIGEILASIGRDEEADTYLSRAMLQTLSDQFSIAAGRLNSYEHARNAPAMIEVVQWLEAAVAAAKRSGHTCWADKALSGFIVCSAMAQLHLEDREAAKRELRRAVELAQRFDRSPSYDANRIRFVSGTEGTAYDDFGATALDGVEQMVLLQNSSSLSALWEEIKYEEATTFTAQTLHR